MFCPVTSNCLHAWDCDFCNNFNLYQPINKKILSPAQKERKEKRKVERKELKKSDASHRGKSNKRNGNQSERDLKKLLISWGFECDRVPLSGAIKGSIIRTIDGKDVAVELNSDLWLKIASDQYRIENKRRKLFNKFYNMTEANEITYIQGFCYIMTQDVFRGLTNGVRFTVEEIEDKQFKTLHGFFSQDNADMVTLKSPYKPFIFCLSEETWRKIVQ